ncbi:MAG: VCBS repeat-containing protein [Planctomycetes bacterium]|nr:VCBS repeat-containing protein [Planctomycetota bacterium]
MCTGNQLRVLCSFAVLLALPACGAGLITGLAASNRGNGTAEVRPPELSIAPLLPLVPEPGTMRTVVVANAQIAAAARLRVRLVAAGVAADQLGPSASGQGGSTLITFTLDTGRIAAAVGDPTAADVAGQLDVLVDDVPIAPSVPVLLVRQPEIGLVLAPPATERFLSPLGERVLVQAFGLRSTEVGNLQLLVATADPSRPPAPGQAWPTITRVCSDLRFETPGPDAVLSAVVPGSTFPVNARLFVRDAIAGESTVATNAYYRPDIALALPSQGPTTGGSLVTLIGTALVPIDFSGTTVPAPLRFSDIELSFAKGGRVTRLSAEDFRPAESGTDRLVFTMPASPDGRPGQVDIVLRTKLGATTAQIAVSQVFLFANPKPFFGPRGAVLDRAPVAVTPILLDAEPGTDAAPDFAVLTEQGGVGFLQLLLAQQNGMFQPFAAPRQIGNHEVAAERQPRDIATGDFDGDGVPDLFVANGGAATAVHHLVLGRARPDTPLGDVYRLAGEPGTAICRVGDFDGDGLPDVLLVPGADSPAGLVPRLRLARPTGPGQPGFAPAVYLPVRPLRHDAVDIADLDGDGHLDVVLFRGGSLQLDFAYGNGDGTFTAGQPLDFTVPGYTADERSAAVGVHACHDGTLQSLGIVWAGVSPGLPGAGQSQPGYAVLRQNVARTYAPPAPGASQLLATQPFGRSLMADLDGQPPLELAISTAGTPSTVSLGLLRFDPTGFLPVPGSVEFGGVELPRQIRGLYFARAFPPTPTSPEARAVFVVHEIDIDGSAERRLSTRLIYTVAAPDLLQLLPPDAGANATDPVEGLVGGDFHPISVAGKGRQRDLALARSGFVDLIQNDGYGGFPQVGDRLLWSGLLPRSMTLLPAPANEIDGLVFAGSDSRLAVWRHDPNGASDQVPDSVSGELRLASSLPQLRTGTLADTTRIVVGDVDGDGVDDVVVLLSFVDASPAEGDAAIALLRGKPAPLPNEFPFHVPVALAPVHGFASAIALGDFAASSDGGRELELAVAIPRGTTPAGLDGDHVRFFRYHRGADPSEDRFEPSAVVGGPQVLLAGAGPTEIAAADFDRDGLVDLLVAGADDSALRLFRNVSLPAAGQPEVEVGAFLESLASPQPLPGGRPMALRLSDLNGDGRLDAVAVAEFTSMTAVRSTSVAFYLSSAAGEFSGPQFVSPDRVGDRDARLVLDIGDWNRDAVPDLFLGWNTAGPGDRNVRVLFGGTR